MIGKEHIMFESILNTEGITIEQELLCLGVAVVLGFLISFTYMHTGKYSRNFSRTLVVMPVLISVVMTLVNGNLGTSVAVLGAFSLVRFRSMQGTSRDISFILFSMTIGLATSLGYIQFSIILAILLCLVLFALEKVSFGETKQDEKELKVTIPENLDYVDIFDDIFEKYLKKVVLKQVKTTNLGSMYELNYCIQLKDERYEKEMIDDIRCRNGNLTIVCGRGAFNQEEL